MHGMHRTLSLLLLASCSSKDTDVPIDDDTSHTGEVVYPSDYEAGKYRSTSMTLLPTGEGLDLDGDGEIDNVLASKLPLVDAFVADDLSFEGLNDSLAESVTDGSLIILIEGLYSAGVLEVDVLLGQEDESGVLSVDPVSLESDGEASAHFVGEFTSQEEASAQADSAGVPFLFMPDTPPVLIPMRMARLEATMTDDAVMGTLAGAIPVEDFVNEVVDPLLPPTEDYDPAEFNGLEREELLQQVRDIANLDTVSDIELEGGERAFSAALSFEANAITW